MAKWESLGEMDVGKKVKGLKKKLRQIEELEEKKAAGSELNADQQGKVRRRDACLPKPAAAAACWLPNTTPRARAATRRMRLIACDTWWGR